MRVDLAVIVVIAVIVVKVSMAVVGCVDCVEHFVLVCGGMCSQFWQRSVCYCSVDGVGSAHVTVGHCC